MNLRNIVERIVAKSVVNGEEGWEIQDMKTSEWALKNARPYVLTRIDPARGSAGFQVGVQSYNHDVTCFNDRAPEPPPSGCDETFDRMPK